MPLPLLLVEEDALRDALLDEYAVGIVRRVRPIDFYHESLRPVTDKFIALLLGALSPELIVSDGPSVAEFDSSHCHIKTPLAFFLMPRPFPSSPDTVSDT